MALYTELYSLYSNDEFKNRINIAITVSAETLNSGTPTVDEQKWLAYALRNSRSEGEVALKAVIAANKDATLAVITSALDDVLQAKVDAIRPALVIAYNAV